MAEHCVGLSVTPYWSDKYSDVVYKMTKGGITGTLVQDGDGWVPVKSLGREEVLKLTLVWNDITSTGVMPGQTFVLKVMSVLPLGLYASKWKGQPFCGIYDDPLADLGDRARHALLRTHTDTQSDLKMLIRLRMNEAALGSIVQVWCARWLHMNRDTANPRSDIELIFGSACAPHFAAMCCAHMAKEVSGTVADVSQKQNELAAYGFGLNVLSMHANYRSTMVTQGSKVLMDPLRKVSLTDCCIIDMMKRCNIVLIFCDDTTGNTLRSRKVMTAAAMLATSENSDGTVTLIPGLPQATVKHHELMDSMGEKGTMSSLGHDNRFGVICAKMSASIVTISMAVFKMYDYLQDSPRLYVDGDDVEDNKDILDKLRTVLTMCALNH